MSQSSPLRSSVAPQIEQISDIGPILGAWYVVPKIGAMRKSLGTPEYRRLLSELRNARQAAGLTQRELGQRLKVPHSWVAKVESGERRIDLVEFGWFIEACDADPCHAFARVRGKPTARIASNPRTSRR
jgi:hypothetical protein